MGTNTKKKISNKFQTGGVFAYSNDDVNTNIPYIKKPTKFEESVNDLYTKVKNWYTTPIKNYSTSISTGGYPLSSKEVYTSPRDVNNAFATTGGIMLSTTPTPISVSTGVTMLAPEIVSMVLKPTWLKGVSLGIESLPLGKNIALILSRLSLKNINNYNNLNVK